MKKRSQSRAGPRPQQRTGRTAGASPTQETQQQQQQRSGCVTRAFSRNGYDDARAMAMMAIQSKEMSPCTLISKHVRIFLGHDACAF